MSVQSLDFLHRLNDGGLLFLNHYLEETCGCHVFHISPSDRLIYDGDDRNTAERLKAMLISRPQNADFSYDAEHRFMVYRYHVNEFRNLFVFYPVEPAGTDRILGCLDEINSPVVFFLRGLYHSFVHYQTLLQNDPEQIFQPDNRYWCSILAARMIDPDEPARVIVYDPNSDREPCNQLGPWVSNLSLRDGGSDILNYRRGNRVIQIVPGSYTGLTGPDGSRRVAGRYPVYLHKSTLDELLTIHLTIALGYTVPYRDIYQSYLSAMMADFYLRYFRKEPRVLRVEDIGPFQRLFRADVTRQKSELEQKYQALKQFESERGGFLFSTARELVRSQFNYQAAALNLHVHLNTLYYRQDKLSNMLSIDLTELEAKVMLCDEMFLNDFFRFLEEI